jgi:hypothetical protein
MDVFPSEGAGVLEDFCLFIWAPLETASQSLCPVENFALFIPYDGKRYSFRNAVFEDKTTDNVKIRIITHSTALHYTALLQSG